MSRSPGDTPTTGALSSAISNATVRLLSEYTGRGPTKARTYITGDLITVVLQDTLTKGERGLVRNGEETLVLQSRNAYQRTMSADLISTVEEITGRRVLAFLSGNHIEPDYAIESFVLARRGDEAPRTGLNAGVAGLPAGERSRTAARIRR